MNLADVSSSGGCCSMFYNAPQDLECIDRAMLVWQKMHAVQICWNFRFLRRCTKTPRPFGLSCSDFWPGVERLQRGSAL